MPRKSSKNAKRLRKVWSHNIEKARQCKKRKLHDVEAETEIDFVLRSVSAHQNVPSSPCKSADGEVVSALRTWFGRSGMLGDIGNSPTKVLWQAAQFFPSNTPSEHPDTSRTHSDLPHMDSNPHHPSPRVCNTLELECPPPCEPAGTLLPRSYPKVTCEDEDDDDLERNVISALAAIPLTTMRKFATRSRRFLDAYDKALDGRWAAWAVKKYRGHRVLPQSILV